MEGLQDQAQKEFLMWDACMEVCQADTCLSALHRVLSLLGPAGVPQHPLGMLGRDLAAAIEQTLLKTFVTGVLVPPTRESVLSQCKGAFIGASNMRCTKASCASRTCTGNVVWAHEDGTGDVIIDWRHHKTCENRCDKAFSQSVSDKRVVGAVNAWLKWGRAVHYYGVPSCKDVVGDQGWLFMNRWTTSGVPSQLNDGNFAPNYRKVCHMGDEFDPRKVRDIWMHVLCLCNSQSLLFLDMKNSHVDMILILTCSKR